MAVLCGFRFVWQRHAGKAFSDCISFAFLGKETSDGSAALWDSAHMQLERISHAALLLQTAQCGDGSRRLTSLFIYCVYIYIFITGCF